MSDSTSSHHKESRLQKTLENCLRTLLAAEADKELIEQLSALLGLLKRYGLDGLERRARSKQKLTAREHPGILVPDNFLTMPLDSLLTLIEDERLSRKGLERIATNRFGVPSGSMRSFSNRRMLVDKLRALVRNEQAHATIGQLARRSPDSSK